jgi:hypothetical protein
MSDDMRSVTPEEFLAGTIAVRELIWGTVRPTSASEEGQEKEYLVAVLDTTAFPQINVTDLARLHVMEGESDTVFEVEYCIGPGGNALIKLTSTYKSPVALTFSVAFSCSSHWEFLRQAVEFGGAFDLADDPPGGGSIAADRPHPHLRLLIDEQTCEDLTQFLRAIAVIREQEEKGRALTESEFIRAALDAKRFMGISEVVMYAEEALHLPTKGEQTLRLRGLPELESVVIPDISPAFKDLLLGLVDYELVGMGIYEGEVHLIRMDWLVTPRTL